MKTSFPLQSWYPVVRHGIDKVGRIADISGTGGRRPVFFEQEIFWLRHSEARITFRHGGKIVSEGSSYCDVRNDFLGCIAYAIKGGLDLADRFAVTTASSLSIQISVSIIDEPHFCNGEHAAEGLGRSRKDPRGLLAEIPNDWLYDDEASRSLLITPRPENVWEHIRQIKPISVAQEEDLWSTARDAEQNLARVDSFMAAQKAATEAAIRDCILQ